MKNKRILMISLILLCVVAYFAGYRMFSKKEDSENSEVTTPKESVRNISESDYDSQEHYLLIIKEENLMIYEMPEHHLYDSVPLDSLWIEGEEEALKEGVSMQNLKEVFEFLENHMS